MITSKCPGTILIIALVLSGLLCLNLFGAEIIGKKVTVNLAYPVQVGTVLLEPGKYRLQHVVEEGKEHFFVFSRLSKSNRVKSEVRVKCKIEPLLQKVEFTELHQSAGQLTEVLIRGEMVKHIIIADEFWIQE